jgi:type IV secretion system protein VirD4
VRDVQNVADILVDPTGEKETRDHWQTTAHSLLTGAILHVLYADDDKTLSGVARFLTESMSAGDKAAYRHRLLLLLDEFPSLGRLEFFETALAFIAGYGLKAFLIAQSLNQLEKAYGPNNAILDNCHVRITYGANDDKTARRISDLLGQATEKKTQKTYSGSGLWLSGRSETEQEYARPLLTPGEVIQLPQDDGILLVGGLLPYRARKVRYFLDERFRARAGLPPPDGTQEQSRELLGAVPSEWEGLGAMPSREGSDLQRPHSASSSKPEGSRALANGASAIRAGGERHGSLKAYARRAESPMPCRSARQHPQMRPRT